MSTPNYRSLGTHMLKEYIEATKPELSLSEALYEVLRTLPSKTSEVNLRWLRETDDKDIYETIEKVLKLEKTAE